MARPGDHGGRRYPVSLLGTDEFTALMEGRYIQLRNLTIERADLDAQNVEFRFSPFSVPAGNTSLTLNEGSLVSLNIPSSWGSSRRAPCSSMGSSS